MNFILKVCLCSLLVVISGFCVSSFGINTLSVSLIAWSDDYSGNNSVTVQELYSAIEENAPEVILGKIYLEQPSNSSGGVNAMENYINSLYEKDNNTLFSLLGNSYSSISSPDGIDLESIQSDVDGGNIPTTNEQIAMFLNNYAPQVVADIENLSTYNNSNTVKFTSILFDIEPGSSISSANSIKGLYYLLYFTRKYMDGIDLKDIGIETTLTWNQIQNSSSSTLISEVFGKTLPQPLIISLLLDENNITTNVFAMLYRGSSQLIDNSNIEATTWWVVYVEPALSQTTEIGVMTITPSIGVNSGDPSPLLTQSQLISFLINYSGSSNDILSKYKSVISPQVLGIHSLLGFYNILTSETQKK